MAPLAFLLFAQLGQPAERIARDFSKALAAKDEAWFERHVAKEFVYVSDKGEREDRAATLGHIHRWMHPLGYHVEPSLRLVASRKVKEGLVLTSDLRVSQQLFGFRRMPLTVTTAREESTWVPKGNEWVVTRIRVLKVQRTVDGKVVPK